MINARWLITCTAGGALIMYALPVPILRVSTGIVFIFLFLAGISGILALRFVKSDETSRRDAKQLFSLGLGVVLGGIIAITRLIPNLYYLRK